MELCSSSVLLSSTNISICICDNSSSLYDRSDTWETNRESWRLLLEGETLPWTTYQKHMRRRSCPNDHPIRGIEQDSHKRDPNQQARQICW